MEAEKEKKKVSSEYPPKWHRHLNNVVWEGGTGIVKFCDTIVSFNIMVDVFLRSSLSCQNQQQRRDILSLHLKRQKRR